jgi:serine/threonine protein kinase
MDIEQLAGTKLGSCRIEPLTARRRVGVACNARQTSRKRSVGLKVFPPTLGSVAAFVKRFQTEAHAVAKLSRSNIMHIYEMAEEEGINLLQLRVCRGKTLDKQHAVEKTKKKINPVIADGPFLRRDVAHE